MKVTNEDFVQRLSIKNPNIEPLEEYKGGHVNILCRCKACKHEWMVRPSNLLSGKGCPLCAIKRNTLRQTKSHEDFLLELAKNNPNVDALGQYQNTNSKILFRCKRCAYEWNAKPGHILDGHGCPLCGGSMRKDNDTFLAQLAKINPMIEPLEPYINARKKILCRCSHCNGEWHATPDKLLQGNGCPTCDKRNKTSFPEQAIYYYLKRALLDVENAHLLPNTRKSIDVFLPSLNIGIEYDGYWHKNKAEDDAVKYHICKGQNILLYRIRDELLPQIDGIADRVYIRHEPYNFRTLDDVLVDLFSELGLSIDVNTLGDAAGIREQYFNELVGNSLAAVYPKVAIEWHTEKNGTITPKMVSYGSNERCWWQCSTCQHEWMAAVADRTVGGKSCPRCAQNQRAQKLKKNHEVFVEQLKEINPNLEPLEKYRTTHKNILMRCKVCGNEWPAAPANLLRGRDCPICSRKRGYAKMAETKRRYWQEKREKQDQ